MKYKVFWTETAIYSTEVEAKDKIEAGMMIEKGEIETYRKESQEFSGVLEVLEPKQQPVKV